MPLNLNQYTTKKLIYELIFNLENINYEEDPAIFDLYIIESLRNIVKYHVRNNDLIPSVVDNINNFLMQARFHEDNDKEKRIELINEIISLMNSQIKDEHLIFYRFQLYIRTKQTKYLIKVSTNEIRKEIPHVHDSICHDLYVISSHGNNFTDQDFIEEALPYLQDSNLYYESLNMILKEYPQIFKNLTFYNRVMCVLNMNNEIYKDHKGIIKYNKKIVKRINKEIKK